MTFVFSELAGALKAGGSITAGDVMSARRSLWADGVVSLPEAEAIFELNQLCDGPAPEWVDFVVEALSVFVVNQLPPLGYVNDDNATWLMAQIDRDGRIDSMAELALLVKVLEIATKVPPALKSYALRQIEAVVLTGKGPTRAGGALRPGVVDEAEVTLLRRLVFAPSGEGALIVGEEEAEMLWRIKDATLGADNAPGWRTFFVQALANHLMAHSDYTPLAQEEAQRLEHFMDDNARDVGGFLSKLSTRGFGANLRHALGRGQSQGDHDAAVSANHAVTPIEASWLKGRLDADGALDPLEKALLAFIAEDGSAAST